MNLKNINEISYGMKNRIVNILLYFMYVYYHIPSPNFHTEFSFFWIFLEIFLFVTFVLFFLSYHLLKHWNTMYTKTCIRRWDSVLIFPSTIFPFKMRMYTDNLVSVVKNLCLVQYNQRKNRKMSFLLYFCAQWLQTISHFPLPITMLHCLLQVHNNLFNKANWASYYCQDIIMKVWGGIYTFKCVEIYTAECQSFIM